MIRMHQAIAEKIAAIPGVTSVGLTSIVPMTGSGWRDPVFAEDKTYEPGKIPALRTFKVVSPGAVTTLGNTMIAGPGRHLG